MDELLFGGWVINGRNGHHELLVPGRAGLDSAPIDWPELLFPGSLNVKVAAYPLAFSARGLKLDIRELDLAQFRPEFEISREAFGNNRLAPRADAPRGGDAQVWRARLISEGGSLECWVLRRFGSGLWDELELVSEHDLRGSLGLTRERAWPVALQMFGTWSKA